MLKKVLGKAVAGTAAAGLVLVPTTATVAPQFTNMAYCQYPDSVVTDTDLDLRTSVAPYGTRNVAHVEVEGEGTPQGKVRISVRGVGSWTRTLTGGDVSQPLPRGLDAKETYKVTAKFIGKCEYRNSGDTAYYTVRKAHVNVNPFIISKGRAKFAATFRGAGGLDPQGGHARFTVKNHRGKVVRAGSDRVNDGRAYVDLRGLGKGRYTLNVKFYGTPNFRFAQDSVHFRLGRHR